MILQVISYILQLLEMEKKKIVVFIGSSEAFVASLFALLQLYGTLRENWKIKGKTEIYALPFISKLKGYLHYKTILCHKIALDV